MKPLILTVALVLCGQARAQWTLPAAPDTIVHQLEIAGDRLVEASELSNAGLGCMLLGGVLAGLTAVIQSNTSTGNVAAGGYIGAGAVTAVGLGLQFGANRKVLRAGRTLRRRKY